ncbi:MAG TPA: carotenoid synthesis regulator CarF [Myxococcales bacterium]|nr:carotenoid synthesis regulator CarF [Myxococcales bacterium]HAN32476.1 carotenoid synthesis regulator CarF [Myxococcales bacterium]|tara:strand:+ start:992 stop:1882 length:891 start_codon:yes stop_codon:yes gene_type:complete
MRPFKSTLRDVALQIYTSLSTAIILVGGGVKLTALETQMSATSTTPGYTKGHRVLEVLAIVTLFSLVAAGCWRALSAAGPNDGWWLAAGIFFGYVLADFTSGLVHWMGDRLGGYETPILGAAFIRPFREHHVDPKAMTTHDFIETNGNNSIVTVPLMAAAWLIPTTSSLGLFCFSVALSLAFWIFATNQFHKWSHQSEVPAIVAWAQRTGLILEPNHHQVHHTSPYETYYCITNGWLNAPLHKIQFWRLAERFVERWTHMNVYRDDVDTESSSVEASIDELDKPIDSQGPTEHATA